MRVRSWEGVLEEIVRTGRERGGQSEIEVHVGCDSAHNPGGRVVFATVVCVIRKGHAGRYFYTRHVEPRHMYPVLQTRLLREVTLSLTTAEALTENDVLVTQVHCDSHTDPRHMYPVLQTRLLREMTLSLMTAEALTVNEILVTQVHCDSNTDPKAKSSEHTRMLIGYIQSMGYEYLVKPHAWATFVADRHSRGLARRGHVANERGEYQP